MSNSRNGRAAEDARFEYVDGQQRATFPALLAGFEAQSEAAAASQPCTLDLRYGPHERERFDFFAASTSAMREPVATLLYFHAGYWQSRDKAPFRFIAPAFTRRGLNVALVDYPLCPDVTLAQLVESARHAPGAVFAHVAARGEAAAPMIAAGHSAGAQIAIELALSRSPQPGSQAGPIAGVIGISGVYDLEPLLRTALNDKLRLDMHSARAASPLWRAARACPASFIVGGAETPAFVRQSAAMHEAWLAACNDSSLCVAPQDDHFSVLRSLVAEAGPVADQVDRLIRRVRRPGRAH